MRLNLTRKIFGMCEVIIKKVNPLYYEDLDEDVIDTYNLQCKISPEKKWKIYKITEILNYDDNTVFVIGTSILAVFKYFYRCY